MSAVAVVSELWKPSVVQLVPFVNEKGSNTRHDVPSVYGKKCFPILAVTRSQSGLSNNDSALSVETYSSLALSDYRSEISDNVSVSGRSSTSSVRKDSKFRKITRHSSLRDNRDIMVKFSVQDLNEQSGTLTARRTSITSLDTGVSMTTTADSVSTNGLPKPTLSDKKYLYKQNGFKKPISYTPGEIELRKQRDKYAKEQAQKSKKYKLNVNQLPRSNTPITDHDPDKLNMKQVIRFLQKQKPTITPRSEAKSPQKVSESFPKSAPSNLTVGDKIRSDLKTGDSFRSKGGVESSVSSTKLDARDSEIVCKTSEISIARRSRLMIRDSHASYSQGTTQHRTKYYQAQTQDQSDAHKPSSETRHKSVREESRDRHDRHSDYGRQRERHKSSKKPNKEFKLHRFLTLVPNGEGQKTNPLIISHAAQVKTNNWVRDGTRSNCCDRPRSRSEERFPIRRVSSEKPSVSHYRALKRENSKVSYENGDDNSKSVVLPQPSVDMSSSSQSRPLSLVNKAHRFQKVTIKGDKSTGDHANESTSIQNSSTIRLPSVHDYFEDEDEVSTIQDSSKSDMDRKSPTLSGESENEQKRESNISRTSLESSRCSFYSMPVLSSSPRKGFVPSKPKQSLHVNIPKEEENKEIRISLRQEKDLTASKSYMSDIAPPISNGSSSQISLEKVDNGFDDTGSDKKTISISRVSFASIRTDTSGICEDSRISPDSQTTYFNGAFVAS